MNMLRTPETSVRIAIGNIQVGMYVTAIEKSTLINLTSPGLVSSKDAIQRLIDSGVKFAWIDVKLSSSKCRFVVAEENPQPSETDTSASEQEKQARSTRLSALNKKKSKDPAVNRKKAKKLVSEAKNLASKLIQETFEGNPLSLGEIETWTDDVIDVVLDNPDAIKFVSALRNKDTYLLEHSVNVACLLITFGKFLNFEKTILKQLAIGGMIHDLGKTKVKNEVLNKPGRLTFDEFEHMKLHQVYVRDLLKETNGLSNISKLVCLMHHEKLDGSGYPNGFKADQIPLYGRISAIVDIYDALTAERCYKAGMSPSDAFKILLSMTPHQLDQELVYKFINCLGIYPAGSLVQLSDGSVGLVEEVDSAAPYKPTVKCFYSIKYKKFTEVRSIKLARSALTVERALAPKSLDIDVSPFYN